LGAQSSTSGAWKPISQPGPTRRRALPITVVGVSAAAIVLVLSLASTGEAYIAHPWCTSGRGWAGGFSGSFDSYQQCMENTRLYTANCVANPSVDPLPQVESRNAQPKRR
jgi:hypothetical protein